MQIDGEWYLCDDGVVRPIVRGHVRARDGSWLHVPFLLDIGADGTVFDADTSAILGLPSTPPAVRLAGVGGVVPSVAVTTDVRLDRDDGGTVLFRGEYAAFTDSASLDMSVLGRDIIDLFSVIVDRPGDAVLLLRDRHTYRVERR